MNKKIFGDFDLDRKRVASIYYYLSKRKSDFAKFVYTFGIKKKTLMGNYPRYLIKEIRPRKRKIKYLPIGVTKDGLIVCVPDLIDTPTHQIYGEPGFGKTFLLHRLFDGYIGHFKYFAFNANDWKMETITWRYPNSSTPFIKRLKFTGERPVGLNLIPLIPNEDLQYNIGKRTASRMNIALPFSEVVKRPYFFANLKGSENWFRAIEGLDNVKTFEEFEDKIRSSKLPANSIPKIINTIKALVGDNILSFKKEVVTKIKIEDETDNIIPQLMRCGLVPTLITQDMTNKRSFHDFMNFIIEDLVQHQTNHPAFKHERMCIAVDELPTITKLKQGGELKRIFEKCVATGRQLRICLIFCAQNAKDVSSQMVTNSKYSYIFFMKSAEDLTYLQKNLHLKDLKKMVTGLKVFECVAYTMEDKFIVYNPLKNEYYESKGPFIMKVIPPLSHHEAPSSGKKNIDYKTKDNMDLKDVALKVLKQRKISLINGVTGLKIFPQEKMKYGRKEFPEDFNKPETPSIFELIDYKKVYWEKETSVYTVTYDEMKDKGKVLAKRADGTGSVFIVHKEKVTNEMITYDEMPKEVGRILYDPYKDKHRLVGLRCRKLWG